MGITKVENLKTISTKLAEIEIDYADDYRAANFVAGTNYLAPDGDGSALTGVSVVSGIDDLTDIDTTTTPPDIGDGLTWDGNNWVPSGVAADATLATFTKTFATGEEATYTLSKSVIAPVVSATKEIPQVGFTKNTWDVNASNFEFEDFALATTLSHKTRPTSITYASEQSVAGEETTPMSVCYNSVNDKYYVVGISSGSVHEYDMTTGYTGNSFSVAGQEASPQGIIWDGTYFWVTGLRYVYKYDAAGVYQSVSFDHGPETTLGRGIAWDGTYFWVVCSSTDAVWQYNSAGVYTGTTFSILASDGGVNDITYWDGYLYIFGNTVPDTIYQYSMLGVATGVTFSVDPRIEGAAGVSFDGETFAVLDSTTDALLFWEASTEVYGFTLGTGSFTVDNVGMRIVGNGGEALLTDTDGGYASVTEFNDTSDIASGDWSMYGLSSSVDGVALAGSAELSLTKATPDMTSATTPSGIVTEGSFVSGSEGWRAFDGITSGGWETEEGVRVSWVTYEFASAVEIAEYTIQPVTADTSPKSFKCYASNDGIVWDMLSLEFETSWEDDEVKLFTMDPTGLYKYYKIDVDYTIGYANLQIKEIEFFAINTVALSNQHLPAIGLQIDSTFWIDINSMVATETLRGQTVNYALSNDDRTTWSVSKAGEGVRNIVRDNAGTWEVNESSAAMLSDVLTPETSSRATASGFYTDYDPYKAFDGVTTGVGESWYWSFSDGVWLQYDNLAEETLIEYTMYTAYSTGTPTAWELQGSNTGAFAGEETIVSTVTGQLNWVGGVGRTFTASTQSAYRYYRVVISDYTVDGNFAVSISNIEFSFVGYTTSETWTPATTNNEFQALSEAVGTLEAFGSESKVPAMTSNTTPSGEASSSTNDPSTPPWEAFDQGLLSGRFLTLSGNTTGWLQYKFDTAQEISAYSISGDTAAGSDAGPRDWTFLGSNSGSFTGEEVVLDTQSGIGGWSYDTPVEFVISSPAAFLYYRLNMTANNGDASYIGLDELILTGPIFGLSSFASINQMDSTQLAALGDDEQIVLGTELDLAMILYTDDSGATPLADGVEIDYDANVKNEVAVVGTDYEWDAPAGDTVVIKSLGDYNLKGRVV